MESTYYSHATEFSLFLKTLENRIDNYHGLSYIVLYYRYYYTVCIVCTLYIYFDEKEHGA